MTARRASASKTGRPAQQRPRGRRWDIGDFDDLFENATDIIIINDVDGWILAANRAAREFSGYTQEDLDQGFSLQQVLPPDEYEAALIVTRRALEGLPYPEVYEREAVLRDGNRRVLELRSNVVRRNGRPYALQTIGRDVTDKKDAVAFQTGLLQVAQALTTAANAAELGAVICEKAIQILHVDGAYLWLRRGDTLVGSAASGRGARVFAGLRRGLEDSLIGQIYRAADVLVVNDFAHSLYADGPAANFGVQAMMAVPLRRQEASMGVLVFTDSLRPRCFTGTLRERALIIGAQTTVAMESALTRERIEEEGRVSAALLRVTRAIREPLAEAEVMPEIARGTREVLECDWTAVAIWDASAGALRLTAMEGWAPDAAEELRLIDLQPDGFGLGLHVLHRLLDRQTVEIEEPSASSASLFKRWGIASVLAVPMVRAGRLVGVLAAGYQERRGPFSDRERRLTEGIAAQAAVAVENARLVEDLRRANQLKSEFVSTMSHELRTPLSAILGYTELLREGDMGPIGAEQSDVLDRMLVNGRALLELINMTLDINRLEAGRVVMEVSEFDLEDVFDELRSELVMRAAEKRITLTWPPPVSTLPPLRTDRGKLKVVLRNLVDNAIKFTSKGSVAISSHYNADLERLYLTVQDTGMGVPEESLSQIFEMFRQLERSRLSSRGGVGLGLYLVQRYVGLLNGQVNVRSVLGQGSTFLVELPVLLDLRS